MKFGRKINWKMVAIGVIAVVAVLTRFYRLGEVPAPWHMDEAGMAYDAYSLAFWRVERHMMHLPVYLPNYGDGQSALYAYLTAVFVWLRGGITPLVARLPAAIFSLAVIFFGAAIVKKTLGSKAAILAAFLLTIFPYMLMQGRFGLDCNLFLGMSAMALFVTLGAVQSQKCWQWALAGLAWGVTLYAYALSWVVVPIFLLFLVGYLGYVQKITWQNLVCLGCTILLVAWPLLIFVGIEVLDLPPVFGRFFYIPRLTNNRIETFVLGNWENLLKLPRLLFWVQDGEQFLFYPTFYWVSVPAALGGFWLVLREWWRKIHRREFSASSLMILYFAANIVQVLVNNKSSNDTHHLNSIFWPVAFFIIYGLVYFYRCLKIKKQKWRYLALLLTVYSSAFGIFAYQYFVIFPLTPTYAKTFMFSKSPAEVLDKLAEYMQERQLSEVMAQREIWLDLPRYSFYYLAELVPPTQMDLTSDVMNEVRYGNVHFVFLPAGMYCAGSGFCPTEITQEDVYIINNRNVEYQNLLREHGLSEIYREDAYTIFLKESSWEASAEGELSALI